MLALLVPIVSLAGSPSAEEQAFVTALNRARLDPAAWAVANGLGELVGGDGALTTLADLPPRPPLALSTLLVNSARGHAEEMAYVDYFGHESAVDGRWPNDLVRDAGYPLPTEIPGDGFVWRLDPGANSVESIAAGYPDPITALNALLVDEGVNPPMHRIHLLGSDDFFSTHRELGVGFARDDASTYRNYWAIHSALETADDRFLTGVVFEDLDGDGAYDAGEGLGGVQVAVGDATIETESAGGWALRVGDGTHAIACSGGDFVGSATGSVTVAGASREVDCVSGFSALIVDFVADDLPIAGPVTPTASACDAAGASPGWLLLLRPLVLRRRRGC
ncbi:MAG: hypothetical protein H0V89_14640 [Deltaproteobacteria bacterium]|nr:hypothetical protein [Deltaproteobacteria bacterium]